MLRNGEQGPKLGPLGAGPADAGGREGGGTSGARDMEPDCLEDGDSGEREYFQKCRGDIDLPDSITKKPSGLMDEPLWGLEFENP